MDNNLTRYITENSDKRNKKLKYDFMPSLLEIIERPSHIAGTVVVVAIAVLLIAAVIWASLSKLDIVVNGFGNILPENKVVEIQPLVSGKAESINAKPGDYVHAGDLLIQIENDNAPIDLAQLEYNIEWCRIRREIAENRLANDEYDIPIANYDKKFSNGINQIILEIEIHKDQKRQREKDLAEAKQDLEKAIAEKNENAVSSLESRVESLENNIASSAKSQKSQMYSSLFSLDREMDGYDTQLEKSKIFAENYKIVSPVNGHVNMLSVVAAGQTISPGSSVAAIVPTDKELKFECYVPDKDRAEIETEMEVKIKLSAFSFSEYGAVTGKITYISPSAFSNEKYGNVYVVDIDIDESALNSDIDLVSGLSGNVEIITGKRTVLQYFLEPITNGLNESLKEN
ncbi:multidrug resistance efflux pump/hemolysin secretion protein [Clostridia bacterium]|nr:multidrug resistance efflux pump/hemolysin secretion protein [Clostridia bacterium]